MHIPKCQICNMFLMSVLSIEEDEHLCVSVCLCELLIHSVEQYIRSYILQGKSLQSCPTLCDPMGGSPPGSFVRGILRARILEWVAATSPRGSSQLRDCTHIS